MIQESSIQNSSINFVVYSKRLFWEDKIIGRVSIPLRALFVKVPDSIISETAIRPQVQCPLYSSKGKPRACGYIPAIKRKSPCNGEPTKVSKKQHFEPTGVFNNNNIGEARHSHNNISAQPRTVFQSSNITVPIPSETQDNNKHEGFRYHRLNNGPITKGPVLFDTHIGCYPSANAPDTDYTDVVCQRSFLAANTPTHVGPSLQCDTNMGIYHTKDKLDSYQQLKKCTKKQQSPSCQPRQHLSVSQQSATISNCSKRLQPSTHAKCLLQSDRRLDKCRMKGNTNSYQQMRNRAQVQQAQVHRRRQQFSATHQSATISNPTNGTRASNYIFETSMHNDEHRLTTSHSFQKTSVLNTIPTEYVHLGKCTCVCRHWGAMFWECEKNAKASCGRAPEYTKCCHGGRVILRPPPEYPEYIKSLYKDSHFLDNIRAYNQMFSMTSLGANVDSSINNGKGPTIVFGGNSVMETEFDLIVEEHSRFPQRVNKLHPCYMALQSPLLFIYGEQGYQKDMKLLNVPGQSTKTDKLMSMNMFYCYQIHDHFNHYSLLPRGGKLFQQYVVTAYCAIEQSRLDYIRQKQSDIRNDYLSGLYDAIMRGDRDGSGLGTQIVLTGSFTGGPRYMYAHYLDALAICLLYTIEFQKRSLPHCHSLLWVSASSKIHEDSDVDKYISAELPDPVHDPDGYKVISEFKIHGPCGLVNMKAAYMKDGTKCNRNFQKPYSDKTYIDEDG
ncbi:DNA helicase, partial [Tanacetum coccineum]